MSSLFATSSIKQATYASSPANLPNDTKGASKASTGLLEANRFEIKKPVHPMMAHARVNQSLLASLNSLNPPGLTVLAPISVYSGPALLARCALQITGFGGISAGLSLVLGGDVSCEQGFFIGVLVGTTLAIHHASKVISDKDVTVVWPGQPAYVMLPDTSL